ncbi:hypothetical protein J8Z82_10435 [Yersinia enterocolitica]|uniref:hypothetical protein n=1 Tax=Yersinia enterocolitica TaxID=630 RepID=UPI001C8DD449|nr:hypothetical protein [Yersinia enterocolitica]MBX9485955.1 hypothetical protein [Yersinia enterocolitica]MBX9492204.1 hypothetical protein [Yersinia enterocolitica]
MNINILGIKTSPAGRALFCTEWQKNKVEVVVRVTVVFVKTLFFMALIALVSIGLSLCMLALMADVPMSQRYQAFEGYMNIINIVSQDLVSWSAVTVVVALVITMLKTLHHFYLAAELGYTSLVSYRIAHNPEMKLHLYNADAVRYGTTSPSDKTRGSEK